MLIEIFCQKLIVSNVISVYVDHLKPNFFFTGRHRVPPLPLLFSKNLDPPLLHIVKQQTARIFLHYEFVLPKSLIESIPHGQAIQLNTICAETLELTQNLKELK